MRSEEDENGRQPVGPGGDPIAAEDEDAQKHGFEEEGEHGLGRERGAEDVADRPRVGRPLSPNANSRAMPEATPMTNTVPRILTK